MNSWSGGRPDGFSTVMDVQGFNYFNNGDMDAFHKSNPGKPCIGTEEASAFYTRGIYENSATYKSAYDDNKPGYGATAEEWWKLYATRPWASGAFVWTGFDYRGEPSPFGWPNISSEFGILDTCGFPKDVYYYYQSWWTDKPVLHLMPHWNWLGKEGQTIDVRAFSNCEEVELFLNGQSLGKKTMPKNSHLQWPVKYAPGTLNAKGFNRGKLVTKTKVETVGAPVAIQLTPDRTTIRADGADCSVLTVAVIDAQGRIVPDADKLVRFELSGSGKILGVGNGDPISHEPDVFISPPPVRTIALDGWRMKRISDPKGCPEVAENFDDAKWHRVDVSQPDGQLRAEEAAVFRAHFSLATDDLAATNAILNFGMIDDEGWVYLNGQLVGESHDWRADPFFDVKKFLRVGDNVVVVAVQNHENNGGINKGVSLELASKPVGSGWQRSTFNGLAQVIVQAGREGGEIKLTATADGLAPTTLSIHCDAGTP
jgi:beta-galactosidase